MDLLRLGSTGCQPVLFGSFAEKLFEGSVAKCPSKRGAVVSKFPTTYRVTACAPQMSARFNRFTDHDHRYATDEAEEWGEVSVAD